MSNIRYQLEGWGWSYIFRWHNFLELVQGELLLPLADVLPEDLLQPGDVLLIENSSLPTMHRLQKGDINSK